MVILLDFYFLDKKVKNRILTFSILSGWWVDYICNYGSTSVISLNASNLVKKFCPALYTTQMTNIWHTGILHSLVQIKFSEV